MQSDYIAETTPRWSLGVVLVSKLVTIVLLGDCYGVASVFVSKNISAQTFAHRFMSFIPVREKSSCCAKITH